jgi:peptidyl-prolyl cis-trans isomerase B (cyclophilin B)
MSRRGRKKRKAGSNAAPHSSGKPTAPDSDIATRSRRGVARPALAAAAIVLVAIVIYWLSGGLAPDRADKDSRPRSEKTAEKDRTTHDEKRNKQATEEAGKQKGGFLDTFQRDKHEEAREAAAAADFELEKQFNDLLKTRADGQADLFAKRAKSLDEALKEARAKRLQDPVPHWLTGELLKLVQGEPDKILPHLQKAADAGLDRARLFVSLAQVQVENNLFDQAFQSATKALDRDRQDRDAWNAYTRAAFCVEEFEKVKDRLVETFPARVPAWAVEIEREAERMQAKWEAEQKLRAAEKKADDLPRVRLVIKHRRFGLGPDGNQTKIETTGGGEVVLELFEDQAPATVANFIDLVEKGFYDGTRFHQAVAAMFVAGGDPNSKKSDARDDGTGGPGYVIPDEYAARGARSHFRGSIAMVNTGPRTAGSQFWITLTPQPSLDGHSTVFGRVIKGQEVIDRITRGSTGKTATPAKAAIPGDLLLKAEVIRKRPHEYKVIKLEK